MAEYWDQVRNAGEMHTMGGKGFTGDDEVERDNGGGGGGGGGR